MLISTILRRAKKSAPKFVEGRVEVRERDCAPHISWTEIWSVFPILGTVYWICSKLCLKLDFQSRTTFLKYVIMKSPH